MRERIHKLKSMLVLAMGLIPFLSVAQQTGGSSEFTLQAAIDYATKHNANYANAELDMKSAVYKNREVIGLGLPQISGSVDLKDYFELPTSLLPGQFFGAPAGTFIPVKFGTQWNATAGISVSQLIFSSDYIVGLQAAKEMRILSERSLTRTKTETVVNVTKAYYSALINRERVATLDANIDRVKKLMDDTKAMNTAGFVEKIDLDRVELTYNNLLTEKEKVSRLIGVSETLLKFQMGYNVADPIVLTDKLNAQQFQDLDMATEIKINYEQRPEFALLESQKRLNELDLKRYRLAYLPSLVAYGSYTRQAQRTKFDFFDGSQKWFPIGIIGATLNVPIFSGGQKYYRVEQAKISLQKTTNTMTFVKSSIDFEATTASISYKNAYASMLTQQKNKELAQSIYDTAKKKYDAGVGSNLELIIAETSLKEAETNYLSAVYDLIVAKTDLDKALGNIK
jgi:outer membrane protein TolC